MVHGERHLDHPPRHRVAHERRAHQRTRGVALVRVDQILVRRDEDRQDAKPGRHARDDAGPRPERREIRPCHPEQAEWNHGPADHAGQQATFGRQLMATRPLGGREVAFELPICPGDQAGGGAEADFHGQQAEEGLALGEAEGLAENEPVTCEECEEDDVHDGEIERDQHDDGLGGEEGEGAVQVVQHAPTETRGTDLDFGAVPLVPRDVAQVQRLPLQQGRPIRLRHEQDTGHEYQPGPDQRDPVHPAPAEDARLADPRPHHGAEHGAGEGGVGEEREHHRPLCRGPHVADAAPRRGQRRRPEQAREEAADQLRAEIGRQRRRHLKRHEEEQRHDVDGTPPDRLAERRREKGPAPEADEIEARGERLGDLADSKLQARLLDDGGVGARSVAHDERDERDQDRGEGPFPRGPVVRAERVVWALVADDEHFGSRDAASFFLGSGSDVDACEGATELGSCGQICGCRQEVVVDLLPGRFGLVFLVLLRRGCRDSGTGDDAHDILVVCVMLLLR